MPPVDKSSAASKGVPQPNDEALEVDISVNSAPLHIIRSALYFLLGTLLIAGIVTYVTVYYGVGGGIASAFVLVCQMMVSLAPLHST